MKIDFALSNPPFALQNEIYTITNNHAEITVMLGTKRLAQYSKAYFEYGASWASSFGNGKEILVPLCFVVSNKKQELDFNSQLEHDFDLRLSEIDKSGENDVTISICRPFGIFLWNEKQAQSNIIWNVETKYPDILTSDIIADMLYLAPKNGSGIYRDIWVLEKLKQHGFITKYNVVQVKKISKKVGRHK